MKPEPFMAAVRPVMDASPAGGVGVAVSGGGDSMALLLLLADWAARAGRALAAVTVDHGLRPESAGEAAAVAALCAGRGIPHDVLRWSWDGRGNLQARAREARRELIGAWARERGLAAVAMGHTLDDQAETFVMRLARGSGVDGLSAMAPAAPGEGLVWLRPLLGVRRADLRRWLAGRGVAWAEDTANADQRFERVRARAALRPLAELGLGPERLAATAAAMGRARAALEVATAELARACLAAGGAGDLVLHPGPLREAPEEIRLRLLAGALGWVSGTAYRPRLARLQAALAAVEAGGVHHGFTLHGCVLRTLGARIAIRREPERVAPPVPLERGRWDGRWQLEGRPPAGEGLMLGGLGDDLAGFPEWRALGMAREALVTTPAIRRGTTVMAAPVVRPDSEFRVRRVSSLELPWGAEILR